MSNNVDSARSAFFPRTSTKVDQPNQPAGAGPIKRNDQARKKELDSISGLDAKVDIPDSIKDFSKIKKTVDSAPDIDKSAKVADLKSRINAGTYTIDYDALADKIIESEMR